MDSGQGQVRLWGPVTLGAAISTAAGVVLGVIGPFGSYLNGTLPTRVAYWVGCLWIGWLTFGVFLPLVQRRAQAAGLPVWLWLPPTIALLALLPVTISRVAAVRMWPVVERIGWVEWYAQGLAISALLTLGMMWATQARTRSTGAPAPLSADPRDRLPSRLGRTVLCLQMEDHYVRVHTQEGSALVLMSLSQAIAGLADLDGQQTHRSWWVARAAVAGVIEDGRNTRLRLQRGLEAPVSRARVARLRQSGWLTR